jgi:hypothetical protein
MLGRNAATGGLATVNDMPVSILMLMSTSVQVGGRTLMLGRNAETGGLTTVNDMPVKRILTSGHNNLVILERVSNFLEDISMFC